MTLRACPSCGPGSGLTPRKTGEGVSYQCDRCLGALIGVAVLEQICEREAIQKLWITAKEQNRRGKRFCPECSKTMIVATAPKTTVEVDVCPRCYLIWLDLGEFEKLPKLSARRLEDARDEAKRIARQRLREQAVLTPGFETRVDDDTEDTWLEAVIDIVLFFL